MKTQSKQKTSPVTETRNSGLAIEAFEAFEWIPDDMPVDAMVPAQQMARFANHVLDVSKGSALVFELIGAHECDSECGQETYFTPYHLGILRRMAARSLNSLHQHAEEIANTLVTTQEG